jgi:hypothetical protein
LMALGRWARRKPPPAELGETHPSVDVTSAVLMIPAHGTFPDAGVGFCTVFPQAAGRDGATSPQSGENVSDPRQSLDRIHRHPQICERGHPSATDTRAHQHSQAAIDAGERRADDLTMSHCRRQRGLVFHAASDGEPRC